MPIRRVLTGRPRRGIIQRLKSSMNSQTTGVGCRGGSPFAPSSCVADPMTLRSRALRHRSGPTSVTRWPEPGLGSERCDRVGLSSGGAFAAEGRWPEAGDFASAWAVDLQGCRGHFVRRVQEAWALPGFARLCSKKNLTISRLASGPRGSVKEPAGLPPDQACPAPCRTHCSSTGLPSPSL